MKPTWLIVLYAKSLFKSICWSAPNDPIIIDVIDKIIIILPQSIIISPKGNGIDCHRHYEALLSGCIPICEYNKKTEEKYKDLPVLYTTDYSEITNDYLESKYQEMLNKDYNFEKLFVSYYNTKIQSKIYKQSEYWCNKLVGKSYYTSI